MKLPLTSPFFSVFLLLLSMLSIQCSASLAKSLFPMLGPATTTALRLLFATVVLVPVLRPWRVRLTGKQWFAIVLYGLSTGIMNLCFYQSIARIPLGLAVALEFTGPLAIAMAGSRKFVDFVWVALAVIGLWIILPIHEFSGSLDFVGVAFGLAAGFFWAMYIVFGRRAGNAGGTVSVALGAAVGALAVLPFGIASGGFAGLTWALVPFAFLVGLFSSALPYGLEIIALKQLPPQTFGILMSLEPVLAALSGLFFLGEQLSLAQCVALGCIITASIGATLTIRKRS